MLTQLRNYSSLAQKKTGNFRVHGRLFGSQNAMNAEPIEDAEFGLIIAANPMQSCVVQRARKVISEISRNPNKTLVVIDPRNTDTANKADLFLQVKPGWDVSMANLLTSTDHCDSLAKTPYHKKYQGEVETSRSIKECKTKSKKKLSQ